MFVQNNKYNLILLVKLMDFKSLNCKFLIFLLLFYPMALYAAGGNESMDRPNLQTLSEPPAINEKTIPNFKLPSLPDKLFESASGERQLYIDNIIFVDNTLLDDKTLQALVQPYVKRTVTVNQLEKLRQKISQIYISIKATLTQVQF